ncbi:proprotein convertase subtilisin/kexin type 7-like [Asterias amurensis]|uniref:proprotein convertase subtilisin/kexin type 7-like n=1 Tax=Asterias amurensis TaxID=7602 RepID=UPI003AB7AD58
MLLDRCPVTFPHDVTRHFNLPLLIALWVISPVPVHSFYIARVEYATNQDDTESTSSDMQETLSWAVKFRTSEHRKTVQRTDYDQIAHRISRELDLLNHGQVGELLNHYLFVHASYNKTLKGAEDHADARLIQQDTEARLQKHPDLEWFHRQRIRRRTKRSLNFKDPSYSVQWHLHNHKSPGMDINVTEVWQHNITGTGVVVAVIDDGLEWNNVDLLANYNAQGSWDLNNNDPDPMPEVHKEDGKSLNRHGTRCAGEIAAVANNKCSVGVAFNAQISGIRLLDGPMTDSLEATAFNKNMHINDIYSCSWGPDDDGKTVDGPHPLAQTALKHGVTAGRKGLGSIFVVASGNGGRNEDNCNYDGYANSMYTVTIGAVDESGQMPYYAEQCASMLAVTFSSGAANKRNIVTTDWTLAKGTGCTSSHTGTSAAAPLAAGMIALMLQAKPCLTWRDIQHIIIHTASKVDEKNSVWITNAGGFHHSHKHGFGLMSAWRLVNAAKAWHSVPWLSSINNDIVTENKKIYAGKTVSVSQIVSNSSADDNELETLEHVLVTVSLTHLKRGMLQIQLVCPSGTTSVIGARRKKDDSTEGLKSWTFSTVRCWGEKPSGKWTLSIKDNHPVAADGSDVQKGVLQSWQLKLYGSSMNTDEINKRKLLVSEAMSGIFLDANLTEPCSYYWNSGYEEESYLSSKAMQMLLYVSGLFTLFAVYYTLEQAFCNTEDKEKDEEQGGDEDDPQQRTPHLDRPTGGDREENMRLLEEGSSERLDLDGSFQNVLPKEPDQRGHHAKEEIPLQRLDDAEVHDKNLRGSKYLTDNHSLGEVNSKECHTRRNGHDEVLLTKIHSVRGNKVLRDGQRLGCGREEQVHGLKKEEAEVLGGHHPPQGSCNRSKGYEEIIKNLVEFVPESTNLPVASKCGHESVRTCACSSQSETSNVQYTTLSISDCQSCLASRNVPVDDKDPSKHASLLPKGATDKSVLVKSLMDATNGDGKCICSKLRLVGHNSDSVEGSTLSQFTEIDQSSTVCDSCSSEQLTSLAAPADNHPITSGLLSCAICGVYNLSNSYSKSSLIGAYVCRQCARVESQLTSKSTCKKDAGLARDSITICNEQELLLDTSFSCPPPFFQDC